MKDRIVDINITYHSLEDDDLKVETIRLDLVRSAMLFELIRSQESETLETEIASYLKKSTRQK